MASFTTNLTIKLVDPSHRILGPRRQHTVLLRSVHIPADVRIGDTGGVLEPRMDPGPSVPTNASDPVDTKTDANEE